MQPFTSPRRVLLAALSRCAPTNRASALPTPFILLSTQRTGSSWLLEQLHAHPSIFTHSELFLNEGEGLPRFNGDGKLTFFSTYQDNAGAASGWNARRKLLRSYLNEVYRAREGVGAVGFKLMYSQVRRMPDILSHLTWRRVKILHLVRRNLLDVYLSKMEREARGFAHARPDEAVEQVKLPIDTDKLKSYLRRASKEHEVWSKQIVRMGLERHEIVYEDIVNDPSRLNDAFHFLGQDALENVPTESFRKLAQGSQQERILNYEEVADALRGEAWEELLTQ